MQLEFENSGSAVSLNLRSVLRSLLGDAAKVFAAGAVLGATIEWRMTGRLPPSLFITGLVGASASLLMVVLTVVAHNRCFIRVDESQVSFGVMRLGQLRIPLSEISAVGVTFDGFVFLRHPEESGYTRIAVRCSSIDWFETLASKLGVPFFVAEVLREGVVRDGDKLFVEVHDIDGADGGSVELLFVDRFRKSELSMVASVVVTRAHDRLMFNLEDQSSASDFVVLSR